MEDRRLIAALIDILVDTRTDLEIAKARENIALDLVERLYHFLNAAGIVPIDFENEVKSHLDMATEEGDNAALFALSYLEGNRFGKEPPVEEAAREKKRLALQKIIAEKTSEEIHDFLPLP